MEKITFDITYTQEDYYTANKLHLRSNPNIWSTYLVGIILLLMGFLLEISLLLKFVTITIAILLLTYEFLYLRYISDKLFSGLGFRPTHFEISDEGIEERGEKEPAKYSLSDIHKVLHNKEIILLFIAKYRFYMVPKRAVTPEQWNQLLLLKKE